MNAKQNQSNKGFTLIEMIGVLAIIAILAALLVPKVFSAINDSRFSNTVTSVNAVKGATMNYFGQFGTLSSTNNTAYDTELIKQNFLDRPFGCKVGTTNQVHVVTSSGTTAGTNACYALDGATAITAGSTVVEILIGGVSGPDAWELSKRIDGASLSGADSSVADTLGRVTYGAGGGLVSIYLAHK